MNLLNDQVILSVSGILHKQETDLRVKRNESGSQAWKLNKNLNIIVPKTVCLLKRVMLFVQFSLKINLNTDFWKMLEYKNIKGNKGNKSNIIINEMY